jgi:phosphoribosylformylglycinamidine cyclo-ligase
LENIPRVLPINCAVEIRKNSWPQQPLFALLRDLGRLDENEMYRTFNMGVGMVMIVAPDMIEKARAALRIFPEFKLHEIGQVVPGAKKVTLCA